jgi:hypothetical protein
MVKIVLGCVIVDILKFDHHDVPLFGIMVNQVDDR